MAFYISTVFDSISTGLVNSIIENKINNYIDKSASGETYGVELSKSTILIRGSNKKRGFIILLYFLFMREELSNNNITRGTIQYIYFRNLLIHIAYSPIRTTKPGLSVF